jgi:hypothetical protein
VVISSTNAIPSISHDVVDESVIVIHSELGHLIENNKNLFLFHYSIKTPRYLKFSQLTYKDADGTLLEQLRVLNTNWIKLKTKVWIENIECNSYKYKKLSPEG